MAIISKASPNFNERINYKKPEYIILHYTGMKSLDDALHRLCDPSSHVSAHYTIGRDGEIYQHVDCDKRAWHAGKSFWRGITDMNSASVGIEIENTGHEHGYVPFPEEQIYAVMKIVEEVMGKYHILPENVLAHSDIAPERKEDPGELFPWSMLAQQKLSIWPEPSEEDFETAKTWILDDYVSAVRSYGYDPVCGYEFALRAFERHFAPELILGTLNDEMIARARLACLLRQYSGRT